MHLRPEPYVHYALDEFEPLLIGRDGSPLPERDNWSAMRVFVTRRDDGAIEGLDTAHGRQVDYKLLARQVRAWDELDTVNGRPAFGLPRQVSSVFRIARRL